MLMMILSGILLVVLLVIIVLSFTEVPTWILLGALCLPFYLHNQDLAIVEHGERIIQIQEQRIESLALLIQQSPNKSPESVLLANHDAPVSSVVLNMNDANEKLTEAKEKVLRAEMRIERRQRGFLQFVTWFY